MPFNLIPLLIILAAGGVVVYICIRKFPDVANLDLERLPETKIAKTKRTLIEQRFGRVLAQTGRRLGFLTEPLARAWEHAQVWFRKKVSQSAAFLLKEEKRRFKHRPPVPEEAPAEHADRVERLLADADAYFEQGNFVDAEHKYLEAIRLDDRSSMAYRGLGKVYMKTGAYDDAIKTFEFLLKLTPADDTVYVKLGKTAVLAGNVVQAAHYYEQAITMNAEMPVRHFEIAEIYKKLGDVKKAGEHAARALEFEPDNPRYLDGLLEISIMKGNKKTALDLYKRLRLANPDNKKLVELKERIEKLK